MNDELERQIETTVSSPRVARTVKDSLERLKNGNGGPELQEIARGLLDGSITLRDLTRTSIYSGVFMDQFQRYKDWEAGLSEEQRAEFERETREAYGPDAPFRDR
ncbi:hypothetical protein [Actinoplanes sp. L3-i22]|uniref:hypothetical protein n=1 Tax=Actinoplanes sp. L3-i22 TaxID=2836373 RepID=UPI001C740BB6|nr:hypothetical protein [Actinoplanes sp. L3-i22]BCY09206.1 hypothetical protein L3i22_042940 [Actinoplanes sp. L3-i22]